MESTLLPDKEKEVPPVPLKTYQWEDLRRAREAGGYPWTHLLKVPLEGEVTAEDIIRETTPRRSMSRELTRSRTHSPVDQEIQRILNLDSSPGSSRKHGDEGEDQGVHVPNFSKEISLDNDDANLKNPESKQDDAVSQTSTRLTTPIEMPKSVSPKSILKRRTPEPFYTVSTETREKSKCCHPLVNKLKHLADKTLQKLEKNDSDKSPISKRKKQTDEQEIRVLKSSPGAVRRQKFSAIKLGDSDEMSKTMSVDTPPPRKRKEHIYEDIEESNDNEKSIVFASDVDRYGKDSKESESIQEKKSNASQDPSLITEDTSSLKADEHIMEKLHSLPELKQDIKIEDENDDMEEPSAEEVFQNQLEERASINDSPNITITEITDDSEYHGEHSSAIPIESSPSPVPQEHRDDKTIWSKPSSDHEYEIIEKPISNVSFNIQSINQELLTHKTDDELSSTTSLERKCLQTTSEEELTESDNMRDLATEDISNAEALQKEFEERFFVNTPSTVSRTECEVSTSQVDSSALENLPLKRSSRNKNTESIDQKIQQRIKEGTGKLKTQAGKLKTKLQNIKTKQFTMPEKPKFNLPDRPKFKMPERPKINFPERPKFNLPDRRKFSLPDRPKFKKINISEKLSLGDKKKFTLPERPKFNVPELPKFRMPDRPKLNFPSLSRKKDHHKSDTNIAETSEDTKNLPSVEFEAKTFPRLFSRKKKGQLPKTSSSPTLNREDTPPPTFVFTRVKKPIESHFYSNDGPGEPRNYGNIDSQESGSVPEMYQEGFDFNKTDVNVVSVNKESTSTSDISPSKQEYTHINEINNDEFFVRPRGISRENIQVREYLSDEIRQAFKIPKNFLSTMGDQTITNGNDYENEAEADPELLIDRESDHETMDYLNEDINDRDDGYYTFPPVRPSRDKRKKKDLDSIKYIDDSVNASMHFSEIDLDMSDVKDTIDYYNESAINLNNIQTSDQPIHEYTNEGGVDYQEMPNQSQTLPMPPKRKKKSLKPDKYHSSLHNVSSIPYAESWEETDKHVDDIIVYRTAHEYIVPEADTAIIEQTPEPPRRTRSRSSRGTSFCDDDRTSHGAESLTLDTHIIPADELEVERELRHESPGYATVDKRSCAPKKQERRSISKTPPRRRRKSSSSERKYYTVGATKPLPGRPPRKKSSTSLITLESITKKSGSGDFTQYVEIDKAKIEDTHKNLKSGEVLSKMKDRPLPPPPRPPRGPKRKTQDSEDSTGQVFQETCRAEEATILEKCIDQSQTLTNMPPSTELVEIEASTQTDPLPDDIDFELGVDENLDISMSSSLKDIVDEDSFLYKSLNKVNESPCLSRPTSRSDKNSKISDPKISELSRSSVGRTSPTVILVERRVSSPTRINERREMLTEASLTVQHINVDESLVPDIPPLPESSGSGTTPKSVAPNQERALDRISDTRREAHLDNLVTQKLQVRDLDVGCLNVSELQASKIRVSDIEGMTLQVTELDTKSGHISVSGLEFSQSVIDEIVKKFAEISTNTTLSQTQDETDRIRPASREGQTPCDEAKCKVPKEEPEDMQGTKRPGEDSADPPQRPPPPDLTPLLYSYLQDISHQAAPFYNTRNMRERPFSEFHETLHQSPPPPTRRAKRKPTAPHSDSSSDLDRRRPSPRRMPGPVKTQEPTVAEAGAQFLRVCQNSISRTIRSLFNTFMSYISGAEDKKDVQMALVIFLVLIAGLLMFGLSDSRAIHHHHWEFFNPPDGNKN